jgi:hypothetical protein
MPVRYYKTMRNLKHIGYHLYNKEGVPLTRGSEDWDWSYAHDTPDFVPINLWDYWSLHHRWIVEETSIAKRVYVEE